MSNTLKIILLMFLFLGIIWTTNSCKKDVEPIDTDKFLYEKAKETSGFSWYKNSDTYLERSSGSGHPQPFLRTRYNDIASKNLDANGKVKAGTSFQDGALIVKELIDSTKSIERYAILYKSPESAEADPKGWVWGYINADGSVAIAASEKGGSCISCHSQTENIDYMLMNKYFP